MNFYEFYQLINENTVSQELKKAQKEYSKEFVEKIINKITLRINNEFETGFNLYSKNVMAKWVAYNSIKKSNSSEVEIYPVVRGAHNYNITRMGLNPNKTRIENFIDLGVSFLKGVNDYLLANTDQNGNLNQQLASKFNNPGFTSEDLTALSDQYHDDLKQKQRNKPGRAGKNILSFPDGYSWVDLERGYCEIEKDTMGHCGNVGQRSGDTILSLRDKKNTPHLTFILNNGILGEMKGRGNDKPVSKYHPYIIELLKLPIIKRVKGDGYLPENNFKLSDLKKEEIEELIKTKPDFENDLLIEKMLKSPPDEDLSKEEILKLVNDKDSYSYAKIKLINYVFHPYRNYDIGFKNKILEMLSKDVDNIVRYQVATITNDHNVLEMLSNDRYSDVRVRVAANPHTPTKTLDKLADDEGKAVVEKVAENHNTLGSTLKKLSNYKSVDIRRLVVNNPNTPVKLIEDMMDDEYLNVKIPAMWKISNHPNASSQALDKIIDYSLSNAEKERFQVQGSGIMLQVVNNPKISKESLRRLSKSDDLVVRKAAIEKLGES